MAMNVTKNAVAQAQQKARKRFVEDLQTKGQNSKTDGNRDDIVLMYVKMLYEYISLF